MASANPVAGTMQSGCSRCRGPKELSSHLRTAKKPRRSVVRVQAADALCKDLVNARKDPQQSLEGSATVSFLGAGGKEMSVACAKDSYILDAGLDGGVELPYTCRGGICGACVGRVVEGQVDMSDIADLSFTLNDEEQEMGLALLCMARPVTDCKIETQSDWGYSLGTGGWKGPTGEIRGKDVEPLNPWGSDS